MDNINQQEVVAVIVEDPMSNTNQQEGEDPMRTNRELAEQVGRARTDMYQLLTWVGGIAAVLWAGLKVAMYEVSKADGSPQQLHMENVIVSISSVVIFACCLSGVGLLVVYQRINTYHPSELLSVRLLLMFFFLTAFLSPFLLLTGLFVPPTQLWALIIVTLCGGSCALIAYAFFGILNDHA